MLDPQEIGGVYWITSLIIGQATSFLAVYLYSRRGYDPSRNLWVVLTFLEVGFLAFFTVFVRTIAAKYRGSFYSTCTAKAHNRDKFFVAKSDHDKIDIFSLHPSFYEDIKEEVERWVNQNYEKWTSECPDWFTPRIQKRIPAYMIPASNREEGSSTSW
jgi:hypothetical protein